MAEEKAQVYKELAEYKGYKLLSREMKQLAEEAKSEQKAAEARVNVPPPTEARASCFNENSTAAPRNCCGLHSLHRRRFPCDPRYFMRYVRQIFA